MRSIENGVQYIKTPYVFHCEEDWEFYDYGFIEKSFELLKKNNNIVSVWLRSIAELDYQCRGHYNLFSVENENYYIVNPDTLLFSWNPGLRKLEIQQACIPYPLDTDPDFNEHGLSAHFRPKEMYSVLTENINGYVRHIGWGRHVVN